MNQTTDQKTEYWILGTLQRLVYLGYIRKGIFDSLLRNMPEDLDWWELDETRKEWADPDILRKKLYEVLDSFNFTERVLLTEMIGCFFMGGEHRNNILSSLLSNLYAGKK
jgi:hypothetical protein